jgi:hypothetical protein
VGPRREGAARSRGRAGVRRVSEGLKPPCRYEVDGRDVRDGLALRLQDEVQRDAVLAQVVDAQQRRQHILGCLVQDQHLVRLVGRGHAGGWGGVEVQHPHDSLCKDGLVGTRLGTQHALTPPGLAGRWSGVGASTTPRLVTA